MTEKETEEQHVRRLKYQREKIREWKATKIDQNVNDKENVNKTQQMSRIVAQ